MRGGHDLQHKSIVHPLHIAISSVMDGDMKTAEDCCEGKIQFTPCKTEITVLLVKLSRAGRSGERG